MPSIESIIERNRRYSDGAYIFLLEISLPTGTTLRLARNTEDIEWPAGSGTVWQRFNFDFDEMDESSKGELREVTLRVSNVSRALMRYAEELEEYRKVNGRESLPLRLICVNSNLLDQEEPEGEWEFEDRGIDFPAPMKFMEVRIGADDLFGKPVPRRRHIRDYCSWEVAEECPYVATCDRNISTCRSSFSNSENFGGFPVVEEGGIYE